MWTGLLEGTLDAAMGSYAAAQAVLQSNYGVVFAVHSKKVDAIPEIRTLPEQGATSKFFTIAGSRVGVPKATPQPIVDRLAELCVAPPAIQGDVPSSLWRRSASGLHRSGSLRRVRRLCRAGLLRSSLARREQHHLYLKTRVQFTTLTPFSLIE